MKGYDQWKTASPYDDDQGYDPDKLDEAIKSLNEGRNLECWRLCSFGWKDADIDPEGCTGIKAVKGMHGTKDPKFIVEVGGHKTLCPADEWSINFTDKQREETNNLLTEIVCGTDTAGEWTGDDWSMYFHKDIQVSPVWSEEFHEVDYVKSAEAIVKAAREECNKFSTKMANLSKMFDIAYEECKQQYGELE